jgi:glycosyltransferase involved in cell wall biosynthesis
MAEGKYIARMDGDDISHPERFERQVAFLESNPEIGILGTQLEKIDAEGKPRWEWSLPTDPDVVTWRLLFNTGLCHPTVMIRNSVLDDLDGYRVKSPGLDYELFTRAVLETQLANLPEKLFKLRRHEGSMTRGKQREQIQSCAESAAILHQAVLGGSAIEQIAKLLVWMERKDFETAAKETGVRDLPRVHEYLRSLYEACTRKFFEGKSNIQVLRRALRKLDTVANEVSGGGVGSKVLCKLKSFSIVSARDVLPLIRDVSKNRILKS